MAKASRFLVASASTDTLPPLELAEKVLTWCESISSLAEMVTGPEPGPARYMDYLADERKWKMHYTDGDWVERLAGLCRCHQEVNVPRIVLILTDRWSDRLAEIIRLTTEAGVQVHVWPYKTGGAEAPPATAPLADERPTGEPGEGLEPSPPDSESGVVPIHEPREPAVP